MKYNKKYFNLYSNAGAVTVNGISFNLSMKNILGELFDEYTAFSLKLESFRSGVANTAVIADDFLLLHIQGLDFFNGWDSSPLYNNSRVVELLDYNILSQGMNFLSNCNAINFRRPSTYNVSILLFHTRITTDTSIIVNPEQSSYVFSITGIESYKVKNPTSKVIIPRFPTMKTIYFTLNTVQATPTGTRGRAWTFTNVNLPSLIGFDLLTKYKRFNLISRSVIISEIETGYLTAGSQFASSNVIMSGLNWVNPSIINNNGMQNIHTSSISIINQIRYTQGRYIETYIENPFNISSYNVVNLTLSYSQIISVAETPVNGGNTALHPSLVLTFEIVPID